MAKNGMTKEEIYQKINLLKTNDAKIKYLENLEKKLSLVKPETRKNFYDIQGDLYLEEGRVHDAIKTYKKIGKQISKKKLIEIGKKYFHDGEFDAALMAYEIARNKQGIIEAGNKYWDRMGCKNYSLLNYNRSKRIHKKNKKIRSYFHKSDKLITIQNKYSNKSKGNILDLEEAKQILAQSKHLESPESIQEMANCVYDIIKQMKSKRCDVVASTETSGTVIGWALKEGWKTAYPSINRIKVIPVSLKSVTRMSHRNGITTNQFKKEYKKIADNFEDRYKKLGLDRKKDKIYPLDDSFGIESKFFEGPNGKKRFFYSEVPHVIDALKNVLNITNLPYVTSKFRHSNDIYVLCGGRDTPDKKFMEATTRVQGGQGSFTPFKEFKTENFKVLVPRTHRKRAQNIIHDMKLIGKIVGNKIYQEQQKKKRKK